VRRFSPCGVLVTCGVEEHCGVSSLMEPEPAVLSPGRSCRQPPGSRPGLHQLRCGSTSNLVMWGRRPGAAPTAHAVSSAVPRGEQGHDRGTPGQVCSSPRVSGCLPARLTIQPQKRGLTMPDDRIVQRLEEQLRDAHATNADLRERLGDIEARERGKANVNRKGRQQ
jgi:hypothetical protein